MTTKPTAGPWIAKNWTCHAPITIVSESGVVVADTNGFGRAADECIADAALIAEAGTVHHETGLSPRDLLEQRDGLLWVLKAIISAEEMFEKDTGIIMDDPITDAVTEARAIIAKVEWK